MSSKPKILYLSYDGMTDPLGQSQVMSYQGRMAKRGYEVDILSFDKPDIYAKRKDIIQKEMDELGINWHSLEYHKSPPIVSTLIDLRNGWKKIKELYKIKHYDIVHCRGYITPILGRKCKRVFGSKFLFDMRGWWPDEKKESGLWGSPIYKPVYNYFKGLERKYFVESDISLSLTYAGQTEAVRLGYKKKEDIGVIPTCVNFEVFPQFSEQIRKEVRQELNIPEDAFVLLYSGSLGGNYGTDILFELFNALKKIKPNSIIFCLSRTDENYIYSEADAAGVDRADVRIASTDYAGVHRYLMAGDLGMIVYRRAYSVIGRSPTKLGEYWACGLPAVGLKDIGDLDYLMEKYPSGVSLIGDLHEEEYTKVLQEAIDKNPGTDKLREMAEEYFLLEKGVDSYEVLYKRMLS